MSYPNIWGVKTYNKNNTLNHLNRKYDSEKVIEAMTDQSVGIARYHRDGATIHEDDIKDFLNTHGHKFIKKNGDTYDEIIGLLEDGDFDVI